MKASGAGLAQKSYRRSRDRGIPLCPGPSSAPFGRPRTYQPVASGMCPNLRKKCARSFSRRTAERWIEAAFHPGSTAVAIRRSRASSLVPHSVISRSTTHSGGARRPVRQRYTLSTHRPVNAATSFGPPSPSISRCQVVRSSSESISAALRSYEKCPHWVGKHTRGAIGKQRDNSRSIKFPVSGSPIHEEGRLAGSQHDCNMVGGDRRNDGEIRRVADLLSASQRRPRHRLGPSAVRR